MPNDFGGRIGIGVQLPDSPFSLPDSAFGMLRNLSEVADM
jgi:hypothetical protein